MSHREGRSDSAPRSIEVISNFQKFPEGSVLYRCGNTRVLISASVTSSVPDWMRETGRGWVTAEYAMHPRSNPNRKKRDRIKGRVDGRSQEIQRLIGRALRAAVNLDKLGEKQIVIDCDVLDADGGTRTASITGGFIALALALDKTRRQEGLQRGVLRAPVAAISTGLIDGKVLVDLCYEEDSAADVDMNVVATKDGRVVEVQGTAEDAPVPRAQFEAMIAAGLDAMPSLVDAQLKALETDNVDLGHLFQ